jgi:GntR family transcriptional regulator, transcriptional repressor for pyruvate dehydrogenase complex
MENVKLEKKNLSVEIIDHIISWIMEGRLKSGDRLPTENDLKDIFGVSRLTVREALKQLEMMSLIDIKQGGGTFVKHVEPESYMKSLLPLVILDDNSLKDLLSVRLCIEKFVVELCVKNANQENLDKLEKITKKMKLIVKDGDISEYHKEDVRFHLLLAESSGNKIVFHILNLIQDILHKQVKKTLYSRNACEISVEKHIKLIDAIKMKNLKDAKAIIEAHLKDAQKLILHEYSK